MQHALIFYGGDIVTMTGQQPTAVLVRGETISALGDLDSLRAQAPNAKMVDLSGATLMPAFLDCHSHFTQLAYAQLQCSLKGVSTEEALVKRIQDNTTTLGEWIVARDYDHTRFPGGRHPDLSVLDRAAPNRPLLIQHQSGHMGLLNSAALRALHLTPQTPQPTGGRFEIRDGALTGYAEENAFFQCLRALPRPDDTALAEAYRQAQACYASHGITTIQEGMLTAEMLPDYRLLLEKQLLKLDLVAYCSPDVLGDARNILGLSQDVRGHLKLGGLKIFLDGSPQGRTAWVRKPYVGGGSGYGTLDDAAVENALVCAVREGLQILAHCNGDAAVEQFLRCVSKVEESYPQLRSLRPVILHGQLMGRDQLSQAAELGVWVSFFVAHVYHWGDVHLQNLGLERASAISPAASALQAGVPITFHQDTPVIQPDMFETLWCAVNRVSRGGVLLGEEERLPVWEALQCLTTRAAAQYGESTRKGAIKAGMQADLIVVDRNPLTSAPEDLCAIQVKQTYHAGHLVYGNCAAHFS